jgi:hypothetical protein
LTRRRKNGVQRSMQNARANRVRPSIHKQFQF